jgi:5'-phosphate synthase pdxT subunit
VATKIGVLALQGAFREHLHCLQRCGAQVVEVRRPEQLEGLDGLILPGGESTTIDKLLRRYALDIAIRGFPKPIWGTCAGMIMLSREIVGGLPDQVGLDRIDLRVYRNAIGRQKESFTAQLQVVGLDSPLPAVFIRAPLAEAITDQVEILATFQGKIAAARQGNIWVTAFHPELGPDLRLHQSFLKECQVRCNN